MTHVWLQHPEHGGKGRFSVESADHWRLHGWVDCEPDPEPDPTRPDSPELPAAQLDAAQETDTSSALIGPIAEGVE